MIITYPQSNSLQGQTIKFFIVKKLLITASAQLWFRSTPRFQDFMIIPNMFLKYFYDLLASFLIHFLIKSKEQFGII